MQIRIHRIAEAGVPGGVSNHRNGGGNFGGRTGNRFEQGPALPGEQRFVDTHSSALAAGKNESGRPHSTMIALRRIDKVFENDGIIGIIS